MKQTRLLKLSLFLSFVSTLASCSQEEIPNVKQGNTDSFIRFSALAPKQSRGNATSTATLNQFVVYAFTQSEKLMDGVTVTRNGGSWTYSPIAYWPTSPVNFYAFSPDITDSPDIKGSEGGCIQDYLNSGKTDLLYAVNVNETEKATPVMMNFRHAMSKVNVFLSSSNSRIQIKVYDIVLKNIYLQGTFSFPESTTTPDAPDVTGSWSNMKSINDMLIFYAIGNDDAVILNSTPTDYGATNLDSDFLLPQPLTPSQLTAEGYIGTNIEIDCEIFDSATGAKLWPNGRTPSYLLVNESNAGRLIYSASTSKIDSWKIGRAYEYHISIDNPSVLDQINFSPTVDEYVLDEI